MTHQNPIGVFRSRGAAQRRARCGFTLVEIMIVVLILSVLLNIAMPAMIHARDAGQSRSCVSNLKRIDGAKEEYALDNRLPANSNHVFTSADIAAYIRGPLPTCPTHSAATGYAYNLMTVGVPATCPYGAPQSDTTLVHQYNF